ncbi:MAG TPA: 4Fe-4S dicluster domain-containing protein [Chloroflexota bacterium]|nr:4Fe-4S dicluster domain-containing protein [Chloroflexota bacterium]
MTVHRLDTTLARDLKKFGAFDIDACFNCGNCTAVCNHSSETALFPRRLIRFGQLGMRDRLVSSREAWLCWNCRDCSDTCPRQARPSEYMESVRRYAIADLDPTGISRRMYTSPLFVVGFALFLAVLFAGVLLSRAGEPAAGFLDLFGFIPFELIHDLGVVVMAAIGLVAVINTVRLVRLLSRSLEPTVSGEEAVSGSAGRLIAAVGAVIREMVGQRRFRACEVDSDKPFFLRPWFVHYTIMWGFIGLGVATALDFMFKTPGEVVPLWYPARMLGTAAGLALMYGSAITLARKLRPLDRTQPRMGPSDWLFLGLLFMVGLTGFALEAMVYLPRGSALGYGIFLTHVVLAMELLVLFPFSKFAHALYRPLAYGIYWYKTAPSRDETAGEYAAAD